jgi:hypothetical protein
LAGPSLRSVLDQCRWRILARVRVRSIMDWMKVRAGALLCLLSAGTRYPQYLPSTHILAPHRVSLARPLSIPFLAVPVPVPSPRSSLSSPSFVGILTRYLTPSTVPIVCACPSCGIQELVPPRARAAGSIPRPGRRRTPRACVAPPRSSRIVACARRSSAHHLI